jgi:hypothetical protein
VLAYAVEMATDMGSERFEIRRQHAAPKIDMNEKAVRSGTEQLVKLGWLELVEPSHAAASARFKLNIGRDDEPPAAPCSWPGCPTKSNFALGLCRRCYNRENPGGRPKEHKVVHPLRNMNVEARTADCLTCGPVAGVHIRIHRGKLGGVCPAVIRVNQLTATAKKYGLTLAQYEAKLERQKSRCEICRSDAPLNVDHDHETGAVRDLLCQHCNFAVGQLRDSPVLALRLARYLERHAQQRLPI